MERLLGEGVKVVSDRERSGLSLEKVADV